MTDSSSSNVGEESQVVRELREVIESVGSYAGFKKTQRKECLNLVRRLKLLVPFSEEIRELDKDKSVWGLGLNSLASLKKALLGAKKLLKNCNYGSKIYLVIKWIAYFSFPFLNLVGFFGFVVFCPD